ncbi:hypothetical protein JKP88DRAFT_178296 [Tribonema minus]|uniref:Uncharacterized protein n=1 Tax=Tribonema minus TaxID=303371 RepID=A0A836CJ91_9STRA|nr:hypothetical protein JKP88DRAFT_178296 [Tribonema minus]
MRAGLRANHKFTDLSATVQLAKTKYGVENFLVWHAVQGYWQGVDVDRPELASYKAQWRRLVVPEGISERVGSTVLRRSAYMQRRYGFGLVPPETISAFYQEYHGYLRAHGVDGVKVDAQSILSCLGEGQGGTVALTRASQAALAASVRAHFGGPAVIHCMCHDSAMLLQLPVHYPDGRGGGGGGGGSGVRPIVRGSDDFYPRDPASHGTHIYANAFNALLLAYCGALQDWDMFQTSLGAVGAMHAAARAISGGPVYISDRPGEHDAALIRKMVLEDGSVPRARRSALPTLPSLFVDAQHDKSRPLLSIWNENPAHGHGVVGVFNVYGSRWDQRARAYRWVRGHEAHRLSFTYTAAAEGTIRPRDCHALLRQEIAAAAGSVMKPADAQFAVYLHNAMELHVRSLDEAVATGALGMYAFELASISRVHTFSFSQGRKLLWSSIGLPDLFNAGGAIMSEAMEVIEGGRRVSAEIVLHGSGLFLALCSLHPTQVRTALHGPNCLWSLLIAALCTGCFGRCSAA